ncbi:YolD-like protein [Marininema mesophilum]|uniref:YolD-like protein n=1 Tax=Marininema mesophilum TaxID=1048340 RepID=A0A1H2SIB4_9BACL|nr:YolD-like family protein [Marininema mesophilum]SDW31361.1 YolD-like protein [Marininema mesophilum]
MKGIHRGNKLWEGHRIILPQHEDALWEKRRHQEEIIPPKIDEDELEQMSRRIGWAMEEERPILLTIAGKYGAETFCGFIERIAFHEQRVKMRNGRDIRWIPFHSIIGVEEPYED